jgi:hypothetical protein
MDKVCELGRKLLNDPGTRLRPSSGPPWEDNPAAFLRGLEETAEGCRWLLDRWVEMRTLADCRAAFSAADVYKLIRLQGKFPIEAINDPHLNLIFLAWDTLSPGWAETFWNACKQSTPMCQSGFRSSMTWRELIRRPSDKEAAWALLLSVADRQVRRLEELVGVHEEIAAEDAAELADRASFDPSASFERLRRFQSAKSRELKMTLDELAKLRKSPRARILESGIGDLEFQRADSRCQKPDGKCQKPDGNGQMVNGNDQIADGNGQMTKENGQVTEDNLLTMLLNRGLAEAALQLQAPGAEPAPTQAGPVQVRWLQGMARKRKPTSPGPGIVLESCQLLA